MEKGLTKLLLRHGLGGRSEFIGRVGEDAFGKELKQKLEEEGISTTHVEPVTHCSTGVATILLSDSDNRIIVVPGANDYLTPKYLEKFTEQILTSDVVLLQFEIPLETVRYCLELCEKNGIQVIVNPAPARKLGEEYWEKATYITPNETEVEELFSPSVDAKESIVHKLIVTLGEKGAMFTENGGEQYVPAFPVTPVDTTGAGDTFNGALAVALGEQMETSKAIAFANGAAALSVQRYGAQEGMPTRAELDNFLSDRRNQE